MKKDFLFEVGTEELPHGFIAPAAAQLTEKFRNWAKESRIGFDRIETFSTPRRLALRVTGLSEMQETREGGRKGPVLKAAFPNGNLGPAGKGFLRPLGIESLTESELKPLPATGEIAPGAYRKEEGGQTFLWLHQKESGRATRELLAESLPSILASLEFPKSMRWADLDTPFARPIRWLLALFGNEVVPFEFGGVASDRNTSGHPQFFPRGEKVPVKSPVDYEKTLREKKVIAHPDERRKSIEEQLLALEKKDGIRILEKEKVTPLVLQLTEWPHLVNCEFDAAFLELPREVLASEMVEHQKYFPVEDAKGNFTNRFIVTANIEKEDFVRRGNLKVLTARLRDGSFLWKEDLQEGLVPMGEKLKTVTYMKELGSVWEKVERTAKVAEALAASLGTPVETAGKAARLMKNDLSSRMVYEFPALQGIMGSHYAKREGLPEETCTALREHYQPLGAGAPLPTTELGTILSMAEKIENLIGHFSVGHLPTGSADPYALRRQAVGLIRIFIEKPVHLDLSAFFDRVLPPYEKVLGTSKAFAGTSELKKALMDFLLGRFKTHLKDSGTSSEESDLFTRTVPSDFADAARRIEALASLRKEKDFEGFLGVVKRIENILGEDRPVDFKESLLKDPAEMALFKAFRAVETELVLLKEARKYGEAYRKGFELKGALETFFTEVIVNAPEADLAGNRKALLRSIWKALWA